MYLIIEIMHFNRPFFFFMNSWSTFRLKNTVLMTKYHNRNINQTIGCFTASNVHLMTLWGPSVGPDPLFENISVHRFDFQLMSSYILNATHVTTDFFFFFVLSEFTHKLTWSAFGVSSAATPAGCGERTAVELMKERIRFGLFQELYFSWNKYF